jgi:uncharacterized repeat protein (TIGR03833 family)
MNNKIEYILSENGNRVQDIHVLLVYNSLKVCTNRANVKAGQKVFIVLKEDQRSGKLTEGIVKDILTKSPFHLHGIKVRLENGLIGRVKEIK